jgi:hypothetical protein
VGYGGLPGSQQSLAEYAPLGPTVRTLLEKVRVRLCCAFEHVRACEGLRVCLAHNGAICDRLKEALAIIDKVTVDKMPLRNQLLKQLGPDAA